MDNLLKCDGRLFRAKIGRKLCEGRIRVENGCVYLCQNEEDGYECHYKLGYNYSYRVGDGSIQYLRDEEVSDFRLLDMTAAEIEAYKDWQVGDKMKCADHVREVIFRSGELIVCKDENGKATANYTCDEIYNYGWRLVADPAPEDETVELTMDEIAAKVGVPVEKLRIKKEEGK